MYIDDLLAGEETDERAFDLYENSKMLMSQGGFNLRKWNSNSSELLKNIEIAESMAESGQVKRAKITVKE